MISNAQAESGHALHPVMWEAAQIAPELIKLALKVLLRAWRQAEEATVKLLRTNLGGRPDR